ncbi:MAG: hypothetical protein LV477_10295 [Candidatus Nitrosotalea sp.]|nr:hypothetical protein [Candidatus Nitrosotalea sp.]
MNRRAISTVVGAVFFIIIFTTAVTFVTYDMNLLNNFTDAFVTKSQSDADANHEEFSITKVTVDNNKFNITIQNSGNIPITINRLWILDKSNIASGVSKYDVNQIVYPGNSLTKVGQNLPLYINSTHGYDLKLVTMRGNVKEFFANSASQAPVYLQLFVLPNSGPNNFNTTLLLGVTNNMTNGGALSNIQANMVVKNLTGFGKTTLISGPTPTSYSLLNNGDLTFFKWDYKINGTSGYKVNFQASLKNGYLYNNASQNVVVTSTPQINFTTPANPANETNGIGHMSNLLSTITPQVTGRVEIAISGYTLNTVKNGTCSTDIRIGTSLISPQGALGNTKLGVSINSTSATANAKVPFSNTVQVSGLALGTKEYIQIGKQMGGVSGSTCAWRNINLSVKEI